MEAVTLFAYTAIKLDAVRFGKPMIPDTPVSGEDLKTLEVWKAMFAECVAQAFYVFLCCLSSTQFDSTTGLAHNIRVSLASGFAMMAMFQMVNHVSGGHINPAVTLAAALLHNISILRFFLYFIAQTIGGYIGGVMAKVALPNDVPDSTLVSHLGKGVSQTQGFGIEMILTSVLVIVFISSTDINRTHLGQPGLIIGLTVTLCHLAGIRYTGPGINPSMSLGTALAAMHVDDLWLYLVGPFFGAVLAAFVYKVVLNPLKIISMEEALLKLQGESKV